MRKQLRKLLIIFFCSLSASLFAQKIIEGRVFDAETHKPLQGVLVFAKNTVKSTLTDAIGTYRIIIPEKAHILIFSISGYPNQEVDIKDISTVEVGLRSFSSREIDNIVVIGSRDKTRTKSDSYLAVDIIPITNMLTEMGSIELSEILHYSVPSFNANRQTGADLTDHVNPSSLRGLGPDQVLFLVNGKRYNPSAVINVFGVRGRGNTGTDLNCIPASAVERIEVLRDGAAAQYGSDAVAGVINIVLKNNLTGISGGLSYGTNVTGWGSSLNHEGKIAYLPHTIDGGMLNVNMTYGFKVGKGLMNITSDYLSKGGTLRPNNETIFPDKNFREGAGDAALNSLSLFFNGNFPLKKGEIYTFGGYSHRKTDSYIWNIPFDDTTRNVYEIYNAPYYPHLITDITNLTSTFGYRVSVRNWNADISNTSGFNNVNIFTSHTLNPSMLTKSPTEFFNGNQKYAQNTMNIDVSHKFNKVNLAFGAEFRLENYQILGGEEGSWKTYNNPPFTLIDPHTGGKYLATKMGTSQGFPGFRPEQAVNGKRNNIGFYSDIEWNITNKFLLAGALRYENYSDFGGTFGVKLATRYAFTDKIALRASIQTGFRAPSLSQIFFQSTINDIDPDGNNFEKIVANNQSKLTKQANIPSLTAEKSFNQSLGSVFSPHKNFQFSIDAYHIAVNNRVVLSGTFFENDNAIGKELKAFNVKAAQFFLNALNTKTTGLDLTAKYKTGIGKGILNINFAGNINKMTLTNVQVPSRLVGKEDKVISPRELQMILSSAPQSKFHATATYKINKFSFMGRLTYFSKMNILATSGNLGFDKDLDLLYKTKKEEWLKSVTQIYNPRLVTDLSLNYDLSSKLKFTLGGNNIFDVYPTIQDTSETEGGAAWDGVQMGLAGAYFFGKLAFKL